MSTQTTAVPVARVARGPGPVDPAGSACVRHHPLPFDAVELLATGDLGAWQARTRDATIPHLVEQLETSGALDNFRRVVGRTTAPYRGFSFADSDVHKTLEAIAWEAGRQPDDQRWETFTRETIALLADVQRTDGYLDSHVQGNPDAEPFADMRWGHELYVLGHLIQAAVARARTTGRTDLLDIARRFADLAVTRFGPDGADGVCGHPEIETALVELYRQTGQRSYLDLAQRMVDRRGHRRLGSGPFEPVYHQDHQPVRDVTEAAGHAVRQLYLAAGMADLVAETGEQALLDALLKVWDSAVGTKSYVTGGMGSRHKDEAFGDPYELPPDRAYSETCAAIASLQLSWRMLLLTGESRFADEMERALVNTVAASTARDGTHFFYSNPLQLRTGHDGSNEYSPSSRLAWFECACCPPNLARLVASLHSYVATYDAGGVQLHLYADADLTVPATDLGSVRAARGRAASADACAARSDAADPGVDVPARAHVRVRTAYPWDGRVNVDVESVDGLALALRVPGWVDSGGVRLRVDGVDQVVDLAAVRAAGGYLTVPVAPTRTADGPRRIELDLAMPVVTVTAHPRVDAARGCVALRRGPVVFCVEQADLPPGVVLEDVRLAADATFALAGGVDLGVPVTIETTGVHVPSDDVPLYRVAGTSAAGGTPVGHVPAGLGEAERVRLRAIPYFSWANRAEGAMRVWIPVQG